MTPSRRSFITGLAAFVAAPAIVRATSLMPVRGIVMPELVTNYELLKPRTWTFYEKRWWWVENNQAIYGPLLGVRHDHA